MTLTIQLFGTKNASDTRAAERFFKERGVQRTSSISAKRGCRRANCATSRRAWAASRR